MSSKWMNAVLWTLVSANLIVLVVGGLITWLGYTIPIRLKQFGLSPELTQLGGFASLLVACLGLCGLNYSSHYALNLYGLSCAIFIIILLGGALLDDWRGTILRPSEQALARPQNASASHRQVSAAANSPNPLPKSSGPLDLGPSQAHSGAGASLILNLVYIALLFVLSILLSFAFIFAQYLRRQEFEDEQLEIGVDWGAGADHDRSECGSMSAAPISSWAQRRLASQADCNSSNCTCSSVGARLSSALVTKTKAQGCFKANSIAYPPPASCGHDGAWDKIQVTLAQSSDSNDCRPPAKGAREKPAAGRTTPGRWTAGPNQKSSQRSGNLRTLSLSTNSGLASGATTSNGLGGAELDCALAQPLAPLVHKGIYYVSSRDVDRDDDKSDEEEAALEVGPDDGGDRYVGRRHRRGHDFNEEAHFQYRAKREFGPEQIWRDDKPTQSRSAFPQCRHDEAADGRGFGSRTNGAQPMQHLKGGAKTLDARCRCLRPPLPFKRAQSRAAAALAAKLTHSKPARSQLSDCYLDRPFSSTMPSRFNPSKSSEPRLPVCASNDGRAWQERISRPPTSGSVMAITAAATAALLGGMGDPNVLEDIAGRGLEDSCVDEGFQGLQADLDYAANSQMNSYCQLDDGTMQLVQTIRTNNAHEPVIDFGPLINSGQR